MTKIIISIISVYLLYYAGNIIYDLFLKQDISKKEDDTEEYSLSEFAENSTTEVKEISIDDVENINTPNSFSKKEVFSVREEEQDENRDLEYWRNKFESENDIDNFNEVAEPKDVQEISTIKQVEKVQEPDSKHQSYHKQFYQFLNLAETSVQILADRDGYKIYQSLI